MIQKEIQELLHFEIKEMRSFALKKHEVFIPFEVIDTKEKIELLKDFVRKQYMILLSRSIEAGRVMDEESFVARKKSNR
ncbi:hypothetical protein [Neobacillus bataviensis]|uniref:hypothetical protein n=1 Tax=Neobacillus bataviensis TaxID=220685 RepID=UPI001CBDF2E9|nr:hypothetical protein [Neobacillus bataviensis]